MAPPTSTMARSCCGFLWPLLLSCLCCLLLSPVASSPVAITHLPGFDGPLPFSLETGYVEVDESNGVHLFYSFVQSEKDPARDPLVLWMQGGPGCSGFSGLAYQMGPFQFDVEGYRGGLPNLLYRNETWTKVSNVIFIDSPVGAGFSYATSKEGFESSDTRAVQQLVIFLKKWLKEHPHFLSNKLYVGGDSYCGITIPTLALALDISNEESTEEPLLNLKGYFAGNPKTDERFDSAGTIQFFHGMGIISDELYKIAQVNCRGNYAGPSNALCAQSIQAIDDSDTLELLYLWANDETVRKTLGIRKDTKAGWVRCDHGIPYIRDIASTVETHSILHKKGYTALIYSGDHDSVFSIFGTQAWIKSLNLSITDDWRPWQVDGQVAGFTRSFASNLTFVTVKGAGHTAPEYKPLECFTMFARWISGGPV